MTSLNKDFAVGDDVVSVPAGAAGTVKKVANNTMG